MGPLSIAAGATSLVFAVGKAGFAIHGFIQNYGDAGNDLERIRGELYLLESAVKCLTDDDANSMVRVPKQLNEMLGAALSACKGSVDEIIALVNNYPHRKRGRRVKWLWEGREKAERLRNSLESQKATLNVQLSILQRYYYY